MRLGVPQGALQVPLLYLLALNDVDNYFSYQKILIYLEKYYLTNCNNLQDDIKRIAKFCMNNIFFNKKTAYVQY